MLFTAQGWRTTFLVESGQHIAGFTFSLITVHLDRAKAQLATTLHDQGPQPVVYGLGQKGARALREYGHTINAQLDWTEKNRRSAA